MSNIYLFLFFSFSNCILKLIYVINFGPLKFAFWFLLFSLNKFVRKSCCCFVMNDPFLNEVCVTPHIETRFICCCKCRLHALIPFDGRNKTLHFENQLKTNIYPFNFIKQKVFLLCLFIEQTFYKKKTNKKLKSLPNEYRALSSNICLQGACPVAFGGNLKVLWFIFS